MLGFLQLFSESLASFGLPLEFLDIRFQKLLAACALVFFVLPVIRGPVRSLLSSFFEDDEEVPKLCLGGGFLDQIVYGVLDRARWFNSVFFESVIGQFGIDPSAIFPALKSAIPATEQAAADALPQACGLLSDLPYFFSHTLPLFPYGLLIFSILVKGCQRQICDPKAPSRIFQGCVSAASILCAMLACVYITESDAMRCIMLVYVAVNAAALIFRAAVFQLLILMNPEARNVSPLDEDGRFASQLLDVERFKRIFLADYINRRWYITEHSLSVLHSATGWLRSGNEHYAVLALMQLADDADESVHTWVCVAAFVVPLLYLSTRALYNFHSPFYWTLDVLSLCGMLWLSLAVRCDDPALASIMVLFTVANAALVLARAVLTCGTGINKKVYDDSWYPSAEKTVRLTDRMQELKLKMLKSGYSDMSNQMDTLKKELKELRYGTCHPGMRSISGYLEQIAQEPETNEQIEELQILCRAD